MFVQLDRRVRQAAIMNVMVGLNAGDCTKAACEGGGGGWKEQFLSSPQCLSRRVIQDFG